MFQDRVKKPAARGKAKARTKFARAAKGKAKEAGAQPERAAAPIEAGASGGRASAPATMACGYGPCAGYLCSIFG